MPSGGGYPVLVIQTIAADPLAPANGREVVSRFAGRVPYRVLADARLLISELITNSVRHGHPPEETVEVTAECGERVLSVHVLDRGPGFDPTARYGPPYDTGWGLRLLASLSSEWGVDPGPGNRGSDAWFVLRW